LFHVIGINVLRQVGLGPGRIEGKTYIRPANHVYCSIMRLNESLVFKYFIGKIDATNAFNKGITRYNRAKSGLEFPFGIQCNEDLPARSTSLNPSINAEDFVALTSLSLICD
jgi:hypothetical protein